MIVTRRVREKPSKSSVRITDPHAEIWTRGWVEQKQNSCTLDSEVWPLKIIAILQKQCKIQIYDFFYISKYVLLKDVYFTMIFKAWLW